jgi:hypothetical protein
MIWIFRAIISTDFFAVMKGLTLLHHAFKCPLACTFELVLTFKILFSGEVYYLKKKFFSIIFELMKFFVSSSHAFAFA